MARPPAKPEIPFNEILPVGAFAPGGSAQGSPACPVAGSPGPVWGAQNRSQGWVCGSQDFCCVRPQVGSPQQKPKRLRLVVDVSGSMYRFNGVDGRLERSMEAVCMVMEAFENYEEKFKVMAWTRMVEAALTTSAREAAPT